VLCICLFNPGSWDSVGDPEPSTWVVMVDSSESMDVSDGEQKRITQAMKIANEVKELGEDRGVGIEVRPFHGTLEKSIDLTNGVLTADKAQTNLESSAEQLLAEYVAAGKNIGGVLVLSDGRQTSLSEKPEFYLRAKAAKSKFHTYTLGDDYPVADIDVSSANKMISTFAGQKVSITTYVQVSNSDKSRICK